MSDRGPGASGDRALTDYPRPSVAVDTAVLTYRPAVGLLVLQVRRDPGPGWALPGTFLRERETLDHAVRRSLVPEGSRALGIGAGPIGLGTALFSRLAGHAVTLMDTSAERLAMAKERFSFENGIPAGEAATQAVLAATGGDGFDVVFDATGYGKSMEAAFAFVAHGGALVLVSVVKDEIRFSDPEFHKREMMLIGSRNATRIDFEHVMASIRAGRVPVETLVTHRTTLERVPVDLARWATEKSGLIKAIVRVAP